MNKNKTSMELALEMSGAITECCKAIVPTVSRWAESVSIMMATDLLEGKEDALDNFDVIQKSAKAIFVGLAMKEALEDLSKKVNRELEDLGVEILPTTKGK